jgi:Spy/CpxP family protein refolding chaperone
MVEGITKKIKRGIISRSNIFFIHKLKGAYGVKKERVILSVAVIAFMMVFAIPGFAQREWGPAPNPYTNLNLTTDQITQIQKLQLEFRKAILPLQVKLDQYDLEVRSLYAQGADESQIEAKINQIEKIDLELENKFMEHNRRIRDLLSDEQKFLFDRYGGIDLVLGAIDDAGYGLDYGRGFGYYGRGTGFFYGRGYGRGYKMGYGSGYGYGYGPGSVRGYGANYGRGYGYYGRGTGRGYGLGYSQAYGYAGGYGRGYWCPYWRGRAGRFRNRW